MLPSDNHAALNAGADAFLPKPLSEQHLLRLLAQAIERTESTVGTTINAPQKTKIAVVDDDALILMAWEFTNSQYTCELFASPEIILQKLADDTNYHHSLAAIVTDLNFDNSSINGIHLAEKLKQTAPDVEVFLCTSAAITEHDISPNIAGVLPKTPDDAIIILANTLARKN